jgi:8-oxo-dGTP pyrophosphatase MutT (NUDIX family)
MSENILTLATIREGLGSHQPTILPADRGHASVAIILHQGTEGPEVLFIIRAAHDHDPWSGDIGFPGGRLDTEDAGARQAAERETREELNLNLQQAEYLGRLDDLYGATLPVLVSCFVYHMAEKPALQPNHEVSETFWLPLAELLSPQRHHEATFHYRGKTISHPAVDLLGEDRTVLWGITYRLIRSFYGLFDITFGSGKVAIDARP